MADSIEPQPLTPEQATLRINQIASRGYTYCWDDDVKWKLKSKGLIVGDLNYVLQYGKVSEPGKACATALYFKYVVETKTPNWINKHLRIQVIVANTDEIRVCDVLD